MKNKISYGEKKITINDVARELNVSTTTVSRVISGKGRIGENTRKRVLEYIEEHNYMPNIIAKSLAQSKTNNITVVIPGDYSLVDFPFFQKCLLGICKIAATLDYDVLISSVTDNDMSQLERIIANHKVDGVILTRTMVEDKVCNFLKEKEVPFVAIGSSADQEIIQVDNDHQAGCKELTSIILMKGMRRIALIGGNVAHVVTNSRYQGYLSAFEELGVPIDKNIIYMNANNNVITEKIVEELLMKNVDCIICMDDLICSYVLNKCRYSHIKVPRDIRLASFYNSSLLEHSTPSITSLNFNVMELGMKACSTLINSLEGKEVNKKNLLGYEVSLKESTQL